MSARRDNPYDAVARRYRAVRPGYPADVFAAIESYAGVDRPPRVLEVGPGPAPPRQLADRLRSAIVDDLGGHVTKPYEAVLVLGRRRPSAPPE